MATRKPSSRVVYNRQCADALRLGVADGLVMLADAMIEASDPPDAAPYGEGLIESGGSVAYIDGKKVAGIATKPRGEPTKTGIVAFAGWGFPARFNEFGTINQPARPFFGPGIESVTPDAADHIRDGVSGRLMGIK